MNKTLRFIFNKTTGERLVFHYPRVYRNVTLASGLRLLRLNDWACLLDKDEYTSSVTGDSLIAYWIRS